MELKNVRVRKYQNIVDSELVEIDHSITCLVGKNESGKTAFLQALHKLNPHDESSYDALDQYPRWRFKFDERKGEVNSEPVVQAEFKMNDEEKQIFEEEFGQNSIRSNSLTVLRFYDERIQYSVDLDEFRIFKSRLMSLGDESELRKSTSQIKSIDSLLEAIKDYSVKRDATPDEIDILSFIEDGLEKKVSEIAESLTPILFYFSEYSTLPGRIKLENFLSKSKNELNSSERTANALLELAGTNRNSVKSEDFENRIAELEASASAVTQSVLEYWTSNDHISVDFKIDKDIDKSNSRNHKVAGHYLDIRLRDSLHDITINFDRRSSGFKWFFSFIVAFSEFDSEPKPVIILLDEPGLNLHAKAQNDFLRYIKERLSEYNQVLYTTHSPFMIEPKNLHQVRLVEDYSERKNLVGSKVTSNIFSTNYDTIFPLQSALGYDLAQNLFVGKQNLIVEGTSDFVYLNLISRYLEENERTHLDFSKVTITPVGGASKVATFAALVGQHIDATVFIDADHKQNQQLSELINRGLIKRNKYLTAADFLSKVEADIEDLFEIKDYLNLYNEAFDDNLKESDLNGNDQIVKRITRVRSNFDHGKPADFMLRNSRDILDNLSEETLNRFEEVFKKINETIEL